jgi:sulfur transfer protein SufE
VKGIVSLLLELYNGSTTSDARAFDFIQWLNDNQISLSMQRMQGLEGMLRRIQSKA